MLELSLQKGPIGVRSGQAVTDLPVLSSPKSISKNNKRQQQQQPAASAFTATRARQRKGLGLVIPSSLVEAAFG